jgi:EAL domain-containing protein (putative c-di-GMP-specific phosphodiesterase class I)
MKQPMSRRDRLVDACSRGGGRVVTRATAGSSGFCAVVLGVLLLLTWVGVHASGGTHSGTPHLFYVSIALAALPFGVRGAVTAAFVSAALAAQVPMDTGTGEAQTAGTIAVRAAMFLMVALVTAGALSARRRADTQSHYRELSELISPSATRAAPPDPALAALIPSVLESGAFHAVFQPVYSLHDGALVSVEALTRFHPEPYRSPDKWFAAADHAGLGADLEIAAIRVAIAASEQLPDSVSLSINTSPATLADPRLHELVRATGRSLVVEVTEHAVINDYHLLEETLGQLREAGVLIAVDDAGAGFASLHHIVELAPDIIKLDISLTQDVTSSPTRRALGGALIDFVHRTGATLLVEGIEEADDLDVWVALGADAVQGYLVGRPGPLPAEAFNPAVPRARAALAGTAAR